MSTYSEGLKANTKAIADLKKLVRQGEGPYLEFKKKVNFPEKIIQEMIAFANTQGGSMLVGVDDSGELSGIKFPDEDIHILRTEATTHCRPPLVYTEEIIPLSTKRFILHLHIPLSPGRPHYQTGQGKRTAFVRGFDKCIKASREMEEIIRRSKSKNGVRFTFGDAEKKLMMYLAEQPAITLEAYMKLAGLNRYQASRKLVLLVLANVITITPTEKGDIYSRL